MRSALGPTVLVGIVVACSSGTGAPDSTGSAGEAGEAVAGSPSGGASHGGTSDGARAGDANAGSGTVAGASEGGASSDAGAPAAGGAGGAEWVPSAGQSGDGGAPSSEAGGAGSPSAPVEGGAAGVPSAGAPPGGAGAGGEPTSVPCVCDSGPCCDGCQYRPKSHFCGEVVRDSYCSGNDVPSCAGATERITLDYWNLFCNGDSSECTRWALHTKYVVPECAGATVCIEGAEQASCQACPN